MRGILLVFTYNWRLKLAALALAVLLWVTVSADQPTTRWLQVPVEVQIRDPNVELLAPPEPHDVRVRLSGTWRELWAVMAERPPVRVVLNELAEGVHELALDPAYLVVPRPYAGAVSALDIRPAAVRVEALRVARADLPVELVFRDTLRADLAFADSIELQPGLVRVSGPAEAVAGITRLHTHPLELPRASGEFVRRVAIDTTGLGNVRLSATQIVVSGRLDPLAEMTLQEVAVQRPDEAIVVPGVVEVNLRGAESRVRQAPGSLRVVIPSELLPPRLPPAGADLALRIEGLPIGVTATVQPRIVRVLPAPAPPPPTPPAAVPTPADTVPDVVDEDVDVE